MNLLPRLFLFAWLALVPAFAADSVTEAVRRADDARVAATLAADKTGLGEALSDSLHYAHSSGKIDTKSSYVQSLISRTTVYDSYKYVDRTFVPAGAGVMLMYGRALIHALSGGRSVLHDLNFLAVWREENGVWRFCAWQSCENPPPAPAAAK